MSWLKLLFYGTMSEQSAVLALFSPHPPSLQLLLFLAGHALSSTLTALLVAVTLPRRFSSRRRWLLLLVGSLCFFIPVLGTIGMLAAMITFRLTRHRSKRPEFHSLKLPPFMEEGARMTPGMGEGGAWSRLRTASLPRPQRLKALLAVGSSGGRTVNLLLRLATGDSDDEIRLLAFNLFDRQERVISHSISLGLEALKDAVDPYQRAEICRSLALSHWEMVYNGLAQAELQDFFVDQALYYATEARDLGGNDPVLALLMGRIYLMRHQIEQAEQSVVEAQALGALPSRVVPYLAELAYLRHDFAALKQYVALDPSLRHKPGIGPVAQFWGGRAWQQ